MHINPIKIAWIPAIQEVSRRPSLLPAPSLSFWLNDNPSFLSTPAGCEAKLECLSGDFSRSAVSPGSQGSGHQAGQMSEARRSTEVRCHQGEYPPSTLNLLAGLGSVTWVSSTVFGHMVWNPEAATQISDGTVLHRQLQPKEPWCGWSPQQRAPVKAAQL